MLSPMLSGSDQTGLLSRHWSACPCGGLPGGGEQDGETVLVGPAGVDVFKADFRVVAVAFGAFDRCVDDDGALPGGFSADEDTVLFLRPWGGVQEELCPEAGNP